MSGCTAIAEGLHGSIGGGDGFAIPGAIAVEATGALVVVDAGGKGAGAVVRVDPHTGDRKLVSGCWRSTRSLIVLR